MSAVRHDPLTLAQAAQIMREADARLLPKIAQAADGCWRWVAAIDQYGYGRFRQRDRNALAHRVVYELLVGSIAVDLTLDHRCRNRWCVNPAHLEPVSLAENIRRGTGVGVANATKTHCKHGHELTPENIYWKQGKRACRECGRQATRRWRERSG